MANEKAEMRKAENKRNREGKGGFERERVGLQKGLVTKQGGGCWGR
jgi:hypothetical protein